MVDENRRYRNSHDSLKIRHFTVMFRVVHVLARGIELVNLRFKFVVRFKIAAETGKDTSERAGNRVGSGDDCQDAENTRNDDSSDATLGKATRVAERRKYGTVMKKTGVSDVLLN